MVGSCSTDGWHTAAKNCFLWRAVHRSSNGRGSAHAIQRHPEAISEELFGINVENWELIAVDRTSWRSTIAHGIAHFESRRRELAEERRAARKAKKSNPITDSGDESRTCPACGRVCGSRFGLYIQPLTSTQQEKERLNSFWSGHRRCDSWSQHITSKRTFDK